MARGELSTEILKQGQYVPLSLGHQVIVLFAVNAGLMDDVEISKCGSFEEQLLRYMDSNHPELASTIMETGDVSEELRGSLTKAINDFKTTFA